MVFAVFLPIVFIIYWSISKLNIKYQNLFLVIVSYIFYGWWDWRFLSLIFISTLVDYFIGIGLAKCEEKKIRKILLFTSLGINLGILGFFKYFDFFIGSFMSFSSFFGISLNISTMNIILPVGISFYTLQTLSYSIDVYKKKFTPTKDFIAFAAFVSFFPQLVAGPIERAKNLLPQFYKKREFEYELAVDGLKQMLWGFLKKMILADQCAIYVDKVFNNYSEYSGSSLVFGAVFFTIQVYADFSGYSDIAIGTSKLFGFKLMKNFDYPYFSRDMSEWWRRWHISLTTWFRDYVFIPLGSTRKNKKLLVRNIFIIYILSGLWHGANWTFIIWGGLNALFSLPYILIKKRKRTTKIVAKGRLLPSAGELSGMLSTFSLFTFAVIFFRSETVYDAYKYISIIFSRTLFSIPDVYKKGLLFIAVFIVIEWFGRECNYPIERIGNNWPRILRWSFYYLLILCLFLFTTQSQQFVYFQF